MDLDILKQYQLTAHKTAIYPKRKDSSVVADSGGIIYTALGLCGECSEYCDALDLAHSGTTTEKRLYIKEAGDVCWYLVEFLEELNVPVDVLISSEAYEGEQHKKPPVYYAGVCAELIKKSIRDDGRITQNTLPKIIANLQHLWVRITFDCALLSITVEQVLEENNRKLLSRLNRGKLNGSGDNR